MSCWATASRPGSDGEAQGVAAERDPNQVRFALNVILPLGHGVGVCAPSA
jgi:hypothetical protein